MSSNADTTSELMAVIGDLWCSNRILSDVTQLCDQYGHRFAGSRSEALARDFIADKFRAYGLENVTIEPCRYTAWRRGACSLRILSPRDRALDAVSMVHAPATPTGGLEGEVISIGQGSPAEFEQLGKSVRGKIAMTTLGSPPGIPPLHRVGKYGRATAAGAIAVIFPTEEPGQLIGTGTVAPAYREVGTLPAIGISHETWRYLLRQMDVGTVRVRMTLDGNSFLPDTDTWNIVGEIPGDGSDPDHILVGGHWDGHEMADAALDNALGVLTGLDAMRALGRLRGKLKRTLRFVAFGNEESQQVGSTNYVAQHEAELEHMALMVNIDGLARYSATSLTLGKREDVAGFFRKLIATHKLPIGIRAGDWLPGSSDDWPFLVTGVPAITASGMRSAAEQSRGRGIDHTQADTVDKIDDLRARQAAITLAQFLVAVANEPQRPGPKLPRAEMFKRLEAAGAKQELMDNGRWHPESILGA